VIRRRTTEELRTYTSEILALHWRLLDFTPRPQPINFREFGRTAWFGPFHEIFDRLVHRSVLGAISWHLAFRQAIEKIGLSSPPFFFR
jgi:hypothetical protein